MRAPLRWLAMTALLGAAGCIADGPLAPRVAPAPGNQRVQAAMDTASAPDRCKPRVSVLIRCGGRITRGPAPAYIVDGRVVPADSLGRIDPASIDSIEIPGGLNESVVTGEHARPRVMIIRTRAPR